MGIGLKQSKRTGKHYDLVIEAVQKISQMEFRAKVNKEKEFEGRLIERLKSSKRLKKNLIEQVDYGDVEKINPVELFGYDHKPDATIGKDGTAIELKLIKGGQSIRDMLGQALCYRINYRFAVLVFVARHPEETIIEKCARKNSKEYKLLNALANEFNIFSIIGPKPNGKNILFFA